MDDNRVAESQVKINDDTEMLNQGLQGLQHSLNLFVNRIEGDDYTIGLKKQIADSLQYIDQLPESKNINPTHFDKLNLFCQYSCDIMNRLSEFISNFNVRYTSPNANKKVLDRMLDEFIMELPKKPKFNKETKEDTRNGAELIKDGVI